MSGKTEALSGRWVLLVLTILSVYWKQRLSLNEIEDLSGETLSWLICLIDVGSEDCILKSERIKMVLR